MSLLSECHVVSVLYTFDHGVPQMWPIFHENLFQRSTIAMYL